MQFHVIPHVRSSETIKLKIKLAFLKPQLRIEKKKHDNPEEFPIHFVHANSSWNEEPANPRLNPLYKKLEIKGKNRLITNFWVASQEAGDPYVFMTWVIEVCRSLERDRYVQKKTEKNRKQSNTTLETPDKMSIQSMLPCFERQMKSVDSLMQRPERQNMEGNSRKIEAAAMWRRNATRDREGCVRMHYCQVTPSWPFLETVRTTTPGNVMRA